MHEKYSTTVDHNYTFSQCMTYSFKVNSY